ncbi:MAG: hypothetical protein Q8S58_16085 [Bosea sp. (in: a-proteobacteria)]|uniref:hypothetical protein n=1 Tax=Bosea sp. (in: a-proteobacteria) TaxID=1871050 RepID=UPI002734D700|nr:hypothetical protein [Bosea sp. (in: a-proteobacteria)]MDP3256203.1 hypothetical protein [Bosea sp. (in: a-proteobacteria)]MDP3320644.1 hypothetical protein [Bosea sp. (in: a-proteobacteria)]
MTRRAFAHPSTLALACSATILTGGLASAHDHAVLRGRLVFSDHEKAVVRILDLDSGEVTHSFDLPKPNAGFAPVGDGRYLVVKTGDDQGTIRFLDSGLVRESHGDHDDIEKLSPKLLDLTLTGDKPAHVVSGHGQVALFYDGDRPWLRRSDPKVVLLSLKDLSAEQAKPVIWKSPAPQHGIAVPLGRGELLLSVPNHAYAKGDDKSASSRPNGFEIVAAKGKPEAWKTLASFNDQTKAEASCKLFHGHAAIKNVHAFGCNDGTDGGVLILARQGKGWSARKLAYPDERRTSTIKGGAGRYLIGNYGLKSPYDALIRIDPAAKALTAGDVFAVPGNQGACQFEVSATGKRVANLTADGKLRIYDVAPDWTEVASFEAVPAFDCAFGASTPTPNLAVQGGLAFVSDPENGRIREYNLDTLKQGLDLPVGGKPTVIAGGASGG